MKVDRLITLEDRKRIERAVADAESRTSAEIVPMILEESDSYPHLALMGAIFGYVVLLAAALWLLPEIETLHQFAILIVGMFLGGLAGRYLAPFRRLLLSRHVAQTEVHQRAIQFFFEHGLTRTRDRTGILIFLSLLERRVQVIADEGIHQKAPEKMWDGVVDLVLDGVRRNDLAGGLIKAIERCGELAAQHFPRKPYDVNELPDEIILK